ncbi:MULTISPECIES: cytochrome b N-terminal domain-containing protein [Thermodesulfovibrio]|uniref:Menaquinol-Cytochrome c reductase cytochrome b subunit n=1 Tax=Thermodesulfovibrio yellowstonii (strain ATCC 51303 / DSM 11347 / YP87) TaxID=289376 RepID=B5YL68_THEYD|nr:MULTISPECIES: cytochrome b N-terminal domain-containing protein [Thermodesulfovibrio]ACI21463.1 menaquinol-Cytochrome c reductase cytochrome b subunit [Thermodesulfovibrio yellowstonii DSM 11347]
MNLIDWFLDRFRLKSTHRGIFDRDIPEGINYFYCFGGIAFTAFLICLVSGLFLSFHYIPSEKEAYQSILRIHEEVFLGKLLRGIHKWSANVLIVSIIIHSIRVFVTKSYRPPRELNWIVGLITFVIVMLEGFTGYLLPWDQKAYWATVVGTNIVGSIPFVGQALLLIVRGDYEVSGATLSRFYSLHVLWFPGLIILLLWAHFHMIKKLGISKPL